jgi:hypothetical protein
MVLNQPQLLTQTVPTMIRCTDPIGTIRIAGDQGRGEVERSARMSRRSAISPSLSLWCGSAENNHPGPRCHLRRAFQAHIDLNVGQRYTRLGPVVMCIAMSHEI